MSLKAISTRKKTKTLPKRIKTGIAGAPVSSFQHFNEYIRAECDNKEISSTIKSYLKEILPKKEASALIAKNPEWVFYHPTWIASSILWLKKELPLPENWHFDRAWKEYLESIQERAANEPDIEEENKQEVVRKSPTEIIKENTLLWLGENVEHKIDEALKGNTDKDFSLFAEFKKTEASAQMVRYTKEIYTPLQNDLKELIDLPSSKDEMQEQLSEGYSNLSKAQQKKFLSFINELIDDCDKFLATKKAVRKTRVKKPKAADKQIAKLQFKKEDNEYKLASIPPINIPGAMRLYLFNTKNRMLTELVTIRAEGLEVKGTTISGIDIETSRSTKLRKPEDFLKIVLTKTPNQINKEWSKLTTKTTEANGRVNKDTILLRVLDK